MPKVWYMDDDPAEPNREHHKTPPEFISVENLYKKTGVECFTLDINTYESDGVLDTIKKERGYTYEDELVCTAGQLDPDQMRAFYTEHLHDDAEIRFIYEGSGYFDVRDGEDRWLRIAVAPGDLLVLPSGIYHRFTVDTKCHVKIKRFGIDNLVWRAFNRPADHLPCREHYVQHQNTGFQTPA